MVVALAGALSILIAAPAAAPATAQERPVDLELVLAVDASASVSGEEFDLQVFGLAEAFRHRSVGQAIRAAGDLGLAVALIHGADYRQHALSVDWTGLRDAASARQFAKQVDGVRRSVAGSTAVGGALELQDGELERAADPGVAAHRAPHPFDLLGELAGAGRVAQHRPVDRKGVLAVVRPLNERDREPKIAGGADRLGHRAVPEGLGQAAHLQIELRVGDAGRGIHRQDQLQVDRALLGRGPSRGQNQQGAGERRHYGAAVVARMPPARPRHGRQSNARPGARPRQ